MIEIKTFGVLKEGDILYMYSPHNNYCTTEITVSKIKDYDTYIDIKSKNIYIPTAMCFYKNKFIATGSMVVSTVVLNENIFRNIYNKGIEYVRCQLCGALGISSELITEY